MAKDYIAARCETALSLLDASRHLSYARALRAALTVDLDLLTGRNSRKPPRVATPATIARDFNFGLRDQVAYGISLIRPSALAYLSTHTSLTAPSFEKSFTWQHYKTKYKKEPEFLHPSRKVMLLTYAQWIHFLDLVHEPSVPDILKPLLRERR